MNPADKPIAILILAAGGSSRMGKPKQLLPFGDDTLLTHAIRTAQKVDGTDFFVVIGAESETIEKSLNKLQVRTVVNSNWQEGIGSSIAIGIRKIGASAYRGALILLADQPAVDEAHLTKLLQAFDDNPTRIIATAYPKNVGAPALFGHEHFHALMELSGDQGAQKILKQKDPIVIEPPSYFDDIDTPEDHARCTANLKDHQ
jgi:molybdenum cofactor cytidylyltransferase